MRGSLDSLRLLGWFVSVRLALHHLFLLRIDDASDVITRQVVNVAILIGVVSFVLDLFEVLGDQGRVPRAGVFH